MDPGSYQKVLQLRKAKQDHVEKMKKLEEKKELQGCTFAPKIHTAPHRTFEKGAHVLENKHVTKHIQRHAKARSSKVAQDELIAKLGLPSGPGAHQKAQMGIYEVIPVKANDISSNLDATGALNGSGHGNGNGMGKNDGIGHGDVPAVESVPESPKDILSTSKERERSMSPNIHLSPSSTMRSTFATSNRHFYDTFASLQPPDDESLVEMIDRERREWHKERMQLVQCIQLQQIELEQRAIAAHDKATEIAKDFARAIVGFEERLFSVEDNVEKEITGLKKIAGLLSKNNSTNLEAEVNVLNKKIDMIMRKLEIS